MKHKIKFVSTVILVGMVGVVSSGCGLSPKKVSSKTGENAHVMVTSNFGSDVVGNKLSVLQNSQGESVMGLLQREFKVKTGSQGAFVTGIDGAKGDSSKGWFFYLNGIEGSKGATQVKVRSGDRVWWDLHPFEKVSSIRAVVGSFPQPFLSGIDGRRLPVRIDCAKDADEACNQVQKQFQKVNVPTAKAALGAQAGDQTFRVIVGNWRQLQSDPVAGVIKSGPKKSGVFANFQEQDGQRLEIYDANLEKSQLLGPQAGLIATTTAGTNTDPPVWVITGTDDRGVLLAAQALNEETLAGSFGFATDGEHAIKLPVQQ